MDARAVRLLAWVQSIPLPNWISAGALAVSIGALGASWWSVNIASQQAVISLRQDLRTELSEVDSSMSQIAAARSALTMDVSTGRSVAAASSWDGHPPGSEGGQIRAMADRALRSGHFAAVPLTDAERSTWAELRDRSKAVFDQLAALPATRGFAEQTSEMIAQRNALRTAADRLWELNRELDNHLERVQAALDDRQRRITQRLKTTT